MALGTVKWFSDNEGIGYIITANGEEFFIHHSSIIMAGFKTLSDGDKVSFDIVNGKSGRVAQNICKLDGDNR